MAQGKRIRSLSEKIDRQKMYPLGEALGLVKELSNAKFDVTVDAAVNLGINARKSDQNVRGATVLPRGTGKTVRVAVFADGENADAAREAGIALVGMKAARYLAGSNWFGIGSNETVYDEYYDETVMRANLTPFQRSYAYVLEHGMDAVNADIQNFLHLQENFQAAATSGQLFANTA